VSERQPPTFAVDGEESAVTTVTATVTVTPDTGKPAAAFAAAVRFRIREYKYSCKYDCGRYTSKLPGMGYQPNCGPTTY
jgi:hypothetical protein